MKQNFLKWLMAPLDMPRADVANVILDTPILQNCQTYAEFADALFEVYDIPKGRREAAALPPQWQQFLSAVSKYLDMYHAEKGAAARS